MLLHCNTKVLTNCDALNDLWVNHLDSNILNFQIMSVAFIRQFMAYDKHHVHGMRPWNHLSQLMASEQVTVIRSYSFILRIISLPTFLPYVDDLLITGNDNGFLASFIQALSNWFSLKNLGSPSLFLRYWNCAC